MVSADSDRTQKPFASRIPFLIANSSDQGVVDPAFHRAMALTSSAPLSPFSPDNFEFISTIGSSSSFGEVWKVRNKQRIPIQGLLGLPAGHGFFACKKLRVQPGFTGEDIKSELRAIRKIRAGCHGNIVDVMGDWHHPDPRGDIYYIFMELMDRSLDALFDELHASCDIWDYWFHGSVPGRLRFNHVDILRGLEYIHSLDEVHRDLKPANVLVKHSNGGNILKIADFGFTTAGQASTMYQSSRRRGTELYGAPELFLDFQFSQKSDIWSFGCILFEDSFCCLDRRRPFVTAYHAISYYSNPSIPTPAISWEAIGTTVRVIPIAHRPMRETVERRWQTLNLIFQAVFHRDPKKRPKAGTLIEYLEAFREDRPIEVPEP